MWSSEQELLVYLKRQVRNLVGRGEIPYVIELGWQPFGVVYRAQQRHADDARPRRLLQLPLRLVADVESARVLSYRSERSA
jgi:hypothetical protein